MATDEAYQGWRNRETWAVALWLGNDQGLYEMAREAMSDFMEAGYSQERAERAKDFVTSLLDPDAYEFEFGSEQPPEIRRIAADVGSLWRVDWEEVAEHLAE